ncbi:MAG: ATP synthase F1 subunit gamma [Planctomyces sp.]|jgi:F-type H+-transporting ATPase subunit gamma|nr:ATP synthase F1 subunit gamma [Planctomyces sp.]GDX91538.1 ATP synthase gamma chain [Planctomycetia bacterium]HAV30583.1 ATP synthase F1 subunit gamma [Planctomycetaceae bacterium]HBC60654.1 ATP synthase F1 subunit gamma [Planctomycetaceae bacterium]
MANRRLLVKRLKAVRNIRKITRTMELIATSRFKKAMDRATEAAEYTRKISEIVGDLGQAELRFSHPLLEKHAEEKRSVMLVLTANRGLCGGYNASVLRQAVAHLRGLRERGVDVSLEVSGKRGIKFLNFQKIAYSQAYTHFEDKTTFAEVEVLASRYVDDYIAGRIDRLDVAYTRFISSSKQLSVVETILPISSLAGAGGSAGGGRVDYEFLPSAEEILSEIVPAAFRAKLFKCFLDAIVSEQIARMVAMKGATENADEMAGSLKQQYNRARQAGITSELAEIIGGAAALG